MLLQDLQTYQLAMILGDQVWSVVTDWEYFSRDTLGKQLTRAADSVAANIAEGFGRYHFKENLNFCFYARGSLLETKTWLIKAKNRNLLKEDKFEELAQLCDQLSVKLNNYIKTIGKNQPSKNNT